MTTPSRPSTLLEPSAYVSARDLDAVVAALDDICRRTSTGAAGELTTYLAKIETPLGNPRYQVRRETPKLSRPARRQPRTRCIAALRYSSGT